MPESEPGGENLRPEIHSLREQYSQLLMEHEALADPLAQFEVWFQDAIRAGLREANAMTLATATREGRPSARVVLLKSFDKQGFVFFSNYESRKAADLESNPQACLVFFWNELERQVRVTGRVKRLAGELSTEYFQSRPRSSQVAAWTSRQSHPVPDRETLERHYAEVEERFQGVEVLPRPDFWGGYLVEAEEIEFWAGRPDRMHDRLLYVRTGQGWLRRRLAP
jgi:pyridoxamine 5'-phosphate oxidase